MCVMVTALPPSFNFNVRRKTPKIHLFLLSDPLLVPLKSSTLSKIRPKSRVWALTSPQLFDHLPLRSHISSPSNLQKSPPAIHLKKPQFRFICGWFTTRLCGGSRCDGRDKVAVTGSSARRGHLSLYGRGRRSKRKVYGISTTNLPPPIPKNRIRREEMCLGMKIYRRLDNELHVKIKSDNNGSHGVLKATSVDILP